MWDNLVDACGRGDADEEAAPVITPREARAPSDPEAGDLGRRLSFSEDALRKSDDQADPGRARTPSAKDQLEASRSRGPSGHRLSWDDTGAPRPFVPDEKTIFLHATVLYVGAINLSDQLFFLRFDLYVAWHETAQTPSRGAATGARAAFDPDVRFPTAQSWSETSRLRLNDDDDGIFEGMQGYRATVEGEFRAHLDLSSFPFDSQALQVDVNMGVDRATSHRLICADGWRFDQHPAAANMLLHQVNAEYHIRPLRYYVMRTSALEDARPCSKYILVIPVQRRTRYYLVSLFPTMLATVLVSFVQFEVEHEAIEPRLMVPLTLVFVLIGYKFTINDSLPNLSYMTQLDVYVQFALFHLYYLVAAEGLCFAAVRRGVVATLKRAHHMAWYVAVAYVVAFHLYHGRRLRRPHHAHGGEPPARGAPQEAARAPRREARRRDALREDGAPAHAEEPRGDGRPARGRPRRQQVPRAAAARSTARALPKPRPPEPAGGHHGGLPLQVPAQGLPRAPAPRHGAHRQEVAELPLGPLAEDQVVPRRVHLRELQGTAYPPDVSPTNPSPA